MPTDNVSPRDSGSYNKIFDLAPFPMWIYNLDNLKFMAVNQEAINHYGYTEEEFLTMTLEDIRPKEDFPKLEKAIEAVRSQSQFYKESLFRHTKKDGSIIYVQIKSNRIDFNNKPAEIVTAIDLTERYQQEKHIEKQRHHLSIIGELNEILLKSEDWSQALDQCFEMVGKFLEVNRVYFFQNNIPEETTSQRLEWVNNKNKSQINDPELQNISFSRFPLFMEPLQSGSPFEAIVSDLPPSPTKNILTDQKVRSLLVLPVMVQNNFSGFIGLEDFKKERKWRENEFHLLKTLTTSLGHVIKEAQAHQKLIDNEAKFRSLVQNGTDLIAIVDAKGYYKYVAPTSVKVLGISPENFIGKNALDYIKEEDVPRISQCFEQILRNKQVPIEPYRFLNAQGNWRWIQTELTNHLYDPAIAGIVANTRDVTAEVEKRHSEKLWISLAKIISHPGSIADRLTQALENLGKLSKISLSEVWLISEDKTHLDLISKACQQEKWENFYQKSISVDSVQKGKGLPGRIWKTQKPCIWGDLPQDNRFLRSRAAKLVGLHSAIGIPIIYHEEFLGCLICFSPFEEQELRDQVKILIEVGVRMGAIVKQKITEEQYRNFLNISPDPHFILGFNAKLRKFNNAFCNLLDYKKAELFHKSIFNFIHPDDKTGTQQRLKCAVEGEKTNSFETRFLTKTGKVKWLIWNSTIIPETKVIIAVAKDITRQKIAEQKLSTAYGRLKTAQKIAKLGYWTRNFDSENSEWSEETYNIYGYTPDNFNPTMSNVTQTFHPDDRHLIERDPNNLEPDKVQSFEHRIITASKEVKWVCQEIRLLTDEKQRPFKIEGTIQDITEKKEYELQLKISNERFLLATRASNEMIWEIDHQNNQMTRSQGYEKIINYDLTEAFSKNNSWFRKIDPRDLEEVWNSLQDALQNKKETYWSKEYRLISEDDSLAYFVDRCFIVRDEKGKPIRTVGSALDVTASRHQLGKIKRQNKNLLEIAWLQSHVIRAPLARIMSLTYLAKEQDRGGKSLEEIFNLISVSAEELDKVVHEIIHKTDTLKEDELVDFTN